MTDTSKPVTRRTLAKYNVLFPGQHKAKEIILTIGPGDFIHFRESGGRDTWCTSIQTAFRQAVIRGLQ